MKKTILSLGLLSAMAFAANAQDAAAPAPAASSFKPSTGNITVEVLAQSPFAAGSPFRLNNGLRFRYFLNEGTALRLGVNITRTGFKSNYGFTSESSTTNNGAVAGSSVSNNNNNGTVSVKSSNMNIAFTPGVEFHKSVSERLSVYYGAYALLSFGSAKGTVEVTPGNTKTVTTVPAGTQTTNETVSAGSYKLETKGIGVQDRDAMNGGFTANPNVAVDNSTRASNIFGLNLVLGADYYITKALYLGLECSWGWNATIYKKYTAESSNSLHQYNIANGVGADSPSPQSVTSKSEVSKSTSSNVSPLVNGSTANAAFRFGFWF